MITMDVDEIKDAIRLALVREVKRNESFIQGGRKFDGRIMSINKLRIEYSDVGYGCPMYDIDGS